MQTGRAEKCSPGIRLYSCTDVKLEQQDVGLALCYTNVCYRITRQSEVKCMLPRIETEREIPYHTQHGRPVRVFD